MSSRLIRLPVLLLATLSLWGCAQDRQVPFDESAFAPYSRSGSATIKGTAFTVLRNGNERTAVGNAVIKLVPANAYTDDIAEARCSVFGHRCHGRFGWNEQLLFQLRLGLRQRAMMAVATGPGQSTVQPMPSGANSVRSASVMPTTANLAVW